MTAQFTDDETGEKVSRPELARRRAERVVERTAPQPNGRAEWEPLAATRQGRLPQPARGLPQEAVQTAVPAQPSGPPAEDVQRLHRLGLVQYDGHGNRNPATKYSVDSQRPAYVPKTWL